MWTGLTWHKRLCLIDVLYTTEIAMIDVLYTTEIAMIDVLYTTEIAMKLQFVAIYCVVYR